MRHRLPKPYTVLQAVDLTTDAHYFFTSIARHLRRNAFVPPPFLPGGRELADLEKALRDNS